MTKTIHKRSSDRRFLVVFNYYAHQARKGLLIVLEHRQINASGKKRRVVDGTALM